jgi:phosphopantetheine adenylyltransferase
MNDKSVEFLSRDISILRQSQSKLALDYVSKMGITVSVDELQRITDVFVEICLVKMNKDLKQRIKNLDKWMEEKIKTKEMLND